MSYLQTRFLTHRQQVLKLYKAAVKNERNWFPDRDEWRFKAILVRERFEKNRDVKDLVKAQELLAQGQEELDKWMHPQPLQFPNCPGGVAYGREPQSPDWVLDTWHPMEKAQFPDYFTRRAQLKKDYIAWYVKKYGITKYDEEDEGHIHEFDEEAHGDDHNAHKHH